MLQMPRKRWLAGRGLVPFAGTELEFIVFCDTYEAAWRKDQNLRVFLP